MAMFLVWIFIWDDEIDHGEESKGELPCNNGDAYCSQSRDFIQTALGFGALRGDPSPQIHNLKLFAQMAEIMCSKSNIGGCSISIPQMTPLLF
jgi:hypothetical protein